MHRQRRQIGFAQAVYGTFPFWDRGYDLLARSPDCRPEWLAWLRETCPKLGQPPAGSPIHGLLALPVDRRTWAIIGLSDQGRDDRGRPGAIAFHALFVDRRDYDHIDADPFRLTPWLRSTWTAEPGALPAGTATIEIDADPHDRPEPSDLAVRIAHEIRAGRRRVVPADSPIDDLARQVWSALPIRVRRRATLATWSFDDRLGCTLQAVRRSGLEPESESESDVPPPAIRRRLRTDWTRWLDRARWLAIVVAAAGLSIGLVTTARLACRDRAAPPVVVDRPEPPSRHGFAADPRPEDRAWIRGRLEVLADRLGVEARPDDSLTTLMARIARSARYRGRWLDARRLDELRGSADPEAVRALAWDDHVRRFADDRPWPDDFDQGPTGWQVAVLAWSFHLDARADESPTAILNRLETWLSVDVSTRPGPLSDQNPALDDYRRFLARLPRREPGAGD